MLPLRIEGATRVLAESQEAYHDLAIGDEHLTDGTPVMVSLWEPTPKELAMLVRGGSVKLYIMGTVWPPVVLTTQEPPA